MSEAVLDSSAILAMLWDEPGGEKIEPLIQRGGCVVSAVNVAEIADRLGDRGASETRVVEILDELDVDIVRFDREQAIQTGVLRSATRSAGLSLGDRAALVLARSLKVPAYTTDRAWLTVSIGVDVRLIRPDSP